MYYYVMCSIACGHGHSYITCPLVSYAHKYEPIIMYCLGLFCCVTKTTKYAVAHQVSKPHIKVSESGIARFVSSAVGEFKEEFWCLWEDRHFPFHMHDFLVSGVT